MALLLVKEEYPKGEVVFNRKTNHPVTAHHPYLKK
jgi:hypothetical protein